MKREFNLTVRCVPARYRLDRPAVKINGKICQPDILSTSRDVYKYGLDQGADGDYLVKVCNPSKWRSIGKQTKAEICLWQKMDKEDRVHFLPLVSWGKTKEDKIHWVAQKLIAPDYISPTEEQTNDMFKVLRKYKANDICIGSDYTGWGVNCFMYEGRPRVFDWGCNQFLEVCNEEFAYHFMQSNR